MFKAMEALTPKFSHITPAAHNYNKVFEAQRTNNDLYNDTSYILVFFCPFAVIFPKQGE
jgi:hypothetical protein